MKSEYLREIGCEINFDENDSRKERFEEELKRYGLASYDTWNLDITLAEFLYISFKMYDKLNCIDTHFSKLTIDGEEWDMQQGIDYIIEESKNYLIKTQEDLLSAKFPDKFFVVLKEIIPMMWW